MGEEKLTVARIKKFGENFEISIDPDAALKYKQGEITDLREVLLADNIFSDARKGLVVPSETLAKAFHTTDTAKIADIILHQGEIQISAEHRSQERDERKKRLVHMIHTRAIDSKTGLPHPATRIEAALEEAKIHLDDHKSVEEQFDDVIAKLRPIIPLSIEQKKLTITVPSQFAGKCQQVVRDNSKITSEDWLSDGGWKVVVEVPAGFSFEFIEKLNSLTHGDVVVEE
ncbi:ribosome assembly factor SBDS [Candidatus Woesearchaeota archaeon]|jgi:ribosome maturation protein SDO1|nr:ribosome assembly factor SBDS [Candidatus Woesearchaeota archaeon]MBT5396704.1 ribosome assembly factor SBDS [Candidatus Woesearchaeota archaeon]MBT5924320.1 ribosome assembly factor SBDS [Candidatus Woesearchaeota archaeon]MBT6367509.1 ribosome assembly factor SBDS [Candidatus Woesearchaeota archaeon]MBT7763008.1 ribosome assembly factor SBDS [Candidatus Woesearchaeota archaeon]